MNQPRVLCKSIIEEIRKVFVTDDNLILDKILCGFLAGGHILFEDNLVWERLCLSKFLQGKWVRMEQDSIYAGSYAFGYCGHEDMEKQYIVF